MAQPCLGFALRRVQSGMHESRRAYLLALPNFMSGMYASRRAELSDAQHLQDITSCILQVLRVAEF